MVFRNTEFDGFHSNILGQSAKQEGLAQPPLLLTQFYLPNHWYRIYADADRWNEDKYVWEEKKQADK